MQQLFNAWLLLVILSSNIFSCAKALNVIWAINCGGPEHTDIHGIHYQRDSSNVGVASDYGRNLMITRVVPQDQILYQTERYHTASFTYDLPIPGNGDYVLILKFSEVWFANPNQKVFDVVLNGEHTIVSSLDIFAKVGRGIAHDEVVPFKVKDGRLFVGSDVSQIGSTPKRLSLEFVKGDRDNPKINAIVLVKGSIDEIPRLPALRESNNDESLLPDLDEELQQQRAGQQQHQQDRLNVNNEADDEEARKRRSRLASGPKTLDPYQSDPASTALLPVLIAVAAALPLFFCLCKL
ncbi:hypothetical protein BOX15_Mlig033394g1 [Macrostomum lignano]|uniref:Malectin domain-containing protein n=2 Tax=Macrostomum lignano TaxID=282301 RepID=A0A1I8I9G4_9PLAT|nr:hypothetical protein BOX15_Mlig033394g1 [Macrostomum lignano]